MDRGPVGCLAGGVAWFPEGGVAWVPVGGPAWVPVGGPAWVPVGGPAGGDSGGSPGLMSLSMICLTMSSSCAGIHLEKMDVSELPMHQWRLTYGFRRTSFRVLVAY